MDWDATYTVSRNIMIRVQGYDHFVLTNSISSFKQTEFDSGAMRGLSFFQTPCTPTQAFEVLGEELNVSKEDFEAAIDEMINNQLLIQHQQSADIVPWMAEESGFGRLESQHRMLADMVRVLSYRAAIFQHVNDKKVLEIGCGTGILSIFATQAGAKKVTAIEESRAILTAQQMVEANQCQDTISFIAGNSLDIELDEPVDVIIHELIGRDPFNENVLIYIDDARRRFLKPGGRLLPQRIDVCCYAVQSGTWQDPQRFVAQTSEFNKAYGVDFTPYLARLTSHRILEKRLVDDLSADVDTILSDEVMLYEVDLYNEPAQFSGKTVEVSIPVNRRGRVNGILVFFRLHLDESIQLCNSPYNPHTHWGWILHDLPAEQHLDAGEQIAIKAQITPVDGRERILISLPDND